MSKQCKARNRKGERCRAWAIRGKTKCALHLDPERAARIGSKHGRGKNPFASEDPSVVPGKPLKSIGDVSALLEDTINKVLRGEIDLRTSNAVGFLTGILLKALEKGRVEERLSHLEAIIGRGTRASVEPFEFHSTKSQPNDPTTATSADA